MNPDISLVEPIQALLRADTASQMEAALLTLGEQMKDQRQVECLHLVVLEFKTAVTRRLHQAFSCSQGDDSISDEAMEIAEEMLALAGRAPSFRTELDFETLQVELVPSDAARWLVTGDESPCSVSTPIAAKVTLAEPRGLARLGQQGKLIIPLQLWPGSHLLAESLLSAPELLCGKKVLELGCGCHGLVGIALARACVASALVTDAYREAVEQTVANIGMNIPADMPSLVRASVLDWGKSDECSDIDYGEQFDVIVGADVVHENHHPDLLIPVIERFLVQSGCCWIVNPGAEHRYGVEKFKSLLAAHSFLTVDIIPIPGSLTARLEGYDRHENSFTYEMYRISHALHAK